MEFTVYLAPKGFTNELVYELGDVAEVVDRLVFAPGPPRPVAWAQNIWLNPRRIAIESISDGAAKLKALQRNWTLWSARHNRRARLIEEQLPAVKPKPVHIGTPPPRAPLGAWTLLERDVIVASPSCSSPYPHGEVQFVENKKDPPSRAYLKLWELFTLLEAAPKAGSFCLDMGGSPGGWAWVLASLGCKVLSVDKAPLDPKVESMPGVDYRMLSAFALDPREVGEVDWFFSDVVCYPDRLWRLVDRWRTFGKVKNFVCTIKFQGNTDHETAAKFWAYPGSRLVHLYNNKHELTWVLLDKEEFPTFAPEVEPEVGDTPIRHGGSAGCDTRAEPQPDQAHGAGAQAERVSDETNGPGEQAEPEPGETVSGGPQAQPGPDEISGAGTPDKAVDKDVDGSNGPGEPAQAEPGVTGAAGDGSRQASGGTGKPGE